MDLWNFLASFYSLLSSMCFSFSTNIDLEISLKVEFPWRDWMVKDCEHEHLPIEQIIIYKLIYIWKLYCFNSFWFRYGQDMSLCCLLIGSVMFWIQLNLMIVIPKMIPLAKWATMTLELDFVLKIYLYIIIHICRTKYRCLDLECVLKKCTSQRSGFTGNWAEM